MWTRRFLLDVVSLVPSVFDILPFLVQQGTPDYGPIKVVRIVKLFKLVKLVRLVRGSRIIAKWQTKTAISYANLTLASVFVQIVLTAHLFACLFSLQTIFSNEERLDTWVHTFGYCACLCEAEAGSSELELVPSGIKRGDQCIEVGCAVDTVDHWWAAALMHSRTQAKQRIPPPLCIAPPTHELLVCRPRDDPCTSHARTAHAPHGLHRTLYAACFF